MDRGTIEAPAPVPAADGIWRPKFIQDRQAWVCQRYTTPEDAAHALRQMTLETFGALLNRPDGTRFSPLFVFRKEDADAQCERLNSEGGANG